jgi:hypothetical protein
MIDLEAEALVEPHRPLVGGVHVEHGGVEAPLAVEPVETGDDQGPAQAQALEVGVDGDHVELAQRRAGIGVDLGPTEAGEATVALVEEEPVGIEPGLLESCAQRLGVPAALLGVPLEGPVVHFEPSLVVLAGTKRSQGQLGGVEIERG